jgi:hypothetical protein
MGSNQRPQDDLELPDLDGDASPSEDDDRPRANDDWLPLDRAEEDPFDDTTGEDEPVRSDEVFDEETTWLSDSEPEGGIDEGILHDVASMTLAGPTEVDDAPGSLAEEDASLDSLDILDARLSEPDTGEEGPTADAEESFDEDLPRFDSEDGAELADDSLYDPGALFDTDELTWADRGFCRVVAVDAELVGTELNYGLVSPGDDPNDALRDATWRKLEKTGLVMAASVVPGASVILAVATADRTRARLVRIAEDGVARIVAELDADGLDGAQHRAPDDDAFCSVDALRWDEMHGCIVVSGAFGQIAYRPG